MFSALFSRSQPSDSRGSEYEPLVEEAEAGPTEPTQESTMGREEQTPKPELRKGDIASEWAAYIAGAAFLVATVLIALNSGVPTPFLYHPICQSLGIALFAYGILTLQPTSQPQTKAAGLSRHQLAMILGYISILLGASAIIYNKASHSAPHFTSWHGTIGIISVVWLMIQLLFGAASVWFKGALLGGGGRAKALWKYHRMSGYLIFPLLLVTAHLGGGWSDWSVNNSPTAIRIITFTVAPIIILVAVFSRIRPSKLGLF